MNVLPIHVSACVHLHVSSQLLCGAETWSITKATEKRIDALDQWCLRRIMNITWSDHITNSEVHRRTEHCYQILCVPDALFGHVARADPIPGSLLCSQSA